MVRMSKKKIVSKELTNVKSGRVAKPIASIKKKTAVNAVGTVKTGPKAKIGTHAEEKFTCRTAECNIQLPRYRPMFKHFGKVCRRDDWETLGFWCNLCQIPKFWAKGTDLVRHKQVMHLIDDFPAMLSYCPKPIGCFNEGELLEFSVKKFGMVKQRQKWWEEVDAYAKSRVTQVGYRAWFGELGRNNDVLVYPELAPGVALPHDGEECGEVFRRPEPSRKTNVNDVVDGACDTVEGVSGDIVVDEPMDLSSLSTPGDSLANISVPVKEADVVVSPDVMIVAAVSPKKDYEKLDAYNTIKKLELDVAKANKLLAERDLKIKDLEPQKGEVFNVGKLKFEKLYQNSKKRMEEILVGGDNIS